jgi:hypothetical protein
MGRLPIQSSQHLTFSFPRLYKLFMNSLHQFYMRSRTLLLLTICLPKLLTLAIDAREWRGGTNRLAIAGPRGES